MNALNHALMEISQRAALVIVLAVVAGGIVGGIYSVACMVTWALS